MTENFMRYYVDADGNYLGGWDNNPPQESIEVPEPPVDARQKWNGDSWGEIPASPEEARQYLRDTDWYVIRMHETGEKVPSEVLYKRAAARETING